MDNPLNEQVLSTFFALDVDYYVVKGFSFVLGLPVGILFTKVKSGATTKKETLPGLGDLSLSLRYDFGALYAKYRRLPKVRVGLGISFPTGRGIQVVQGQASNNLTLGRGTFDLLAELLLSWQLHSRVALYATGNLQAPFTEGKSITLGASIQYGLGIFWQFWPKRMSAQLAVDAGHALQAQGKGVGVLTNSGGFGLFISPTLTLTIVKGLDLTVRGRIPVYQYVNGTQLVSQFSVVTSLSYTFPSFAPKSK